MVGNQTWHAQGRTAIERGQAGGKRIQSRGGAGHRRAPHRIIKPPIPNRIARENQSRITHAARRVALTGDEGSGGVQYILRRRRVLQAGDRKEINLVEFQRARIEGDRQAIRAQRHRIQRHQTEVVSRQARAGDGIHRLVEGQHHFIGPGRRNLGAQQLRRRLVRRHGQRGARAVRLAEFIAHHHRVGAGRAVGGRAGDADHVQGGGRRVGVQHPVEIPLIRERTRPRGRHPKTGRLIFQHRFVRQRGTVGEPDRADPVLIIADNGVRNPMGLIVRPRLGGDFKKAAGNRNIAHRLVGEDDRPVEGQAQVATQMQPQIHVGPVPVRAVDRRDAVDPGGHVGDQHALPLDQNGRRQHAINRVIIVERHHQPVRAGRHQRNVAILLIQEDPRRQVAGQVDGKAVARRGAPPADARLKAQVKILHDARVGELQHPGFILRGVGQIRITAIVEPPVGDQIGRAIKRKAVADPGAKIINRPHRRRVNKRSRRWIGRQRVGLGVLVRDVRRRQLIRRARRKIKGSG